ncbi:MAG: repeat, subfamily [Chthonomonadaceae bacterium]|nr:repeat, subfamily [Chthonomonadaceae bacterium]
MCSFSKRCVSGRRFPFVSNGRIGVVLMMVSMACVGAVAARVQDSPNARLVKAVEEDDLKAALAALDQGAAPNATIDDNPVSCIAAYHGQTALLKALLDRGARLDARKFDDHLTLLMFAALSGNPETVQLLLDRKVKINQQDELGETALMTVREPIKPAVTSEASGSSKASEPAKPIGRVAVLKLLLKAGADKEIRDIEGRTALMRYAKYGIQNAVEALAEAGAKLNTRDHDGNTALILAAGWQTLDKNLKTDGYAPIVQCLLQHKADERVKNRAGLTALMAAKRAGHEDIVALLLAPSSTGSSKATREEQP